jgi:hypothetical protein
MKKLLIGLLVLGNMTTVMGNSHNVKTQRVPAAMTPDVGIIGPLGEVLLYYKAGDYIIVKNCAENTVLGSTPAEARENCQGPQNKIPIESFKQALRNLVSIDRFKILKPLTRGEVRAYNENGVTSDQIEKMVIELDKINAFISAYGAENADIVGKNVLVRALSSSEKRVKAINKINAQVENAVSLIVNQTELTLSKRSSDKDQFLYNVLKDFDPKQKFPCGLEGTIDERIKDCSYQSASSSEEFVLVTRSKKFKEVHKELDSGLLWGDRLSSKMSHSEAIKACKSSLDEVANISGVTWRLPSKSEYQEANKNGIIKALPNMSYWFWSSSVHRYYPNNAWLFWGLSKERYGGTVNVLNQDNHVSIRCVAR